MCENMSSKSVESDKEKTDADQQKQESEEEEDERAVTEEYSFSDFAQETDSDHQPTETTVSTMHEDSVSFSFSTTRHRHDSSLGGGELPANFMASSDPYSMIPAENWLRPWTFKLSRSCGHRDFKPAVLHNISDDGGREFFRPHQNDNHSSYPQEHFPVLLLPLPPPPVPVPVPSTSDDDADPTHCWETRSSSFPHSRRDAPRLFPLIQPQIASSSIINTASQQLHNRAIWSSSNKSPDRNQCLSFQSCSNHWTTSSSDDKPPCKSSAHSRNRRHLSSSQSSSDYWSSSERAPYISSRSSSGDSEDSRFDRGHKPSMQQNSARKPREQHPSESPSGCRQVAAANYHRQHHAKQQKNAIGRAARTPDHHELQASGTSPLNLSREIVLRPHRQAQTPLFQQAKQNVDDDQSACRPVPKWKVISLQPLNPSHVRLDSHELRARRLSRSFRERSGSQGSLSELEQISTISSSSSAKNPSRSSSSKGGMQQQMKSQQQQPQHRQQRQKQQHLQQLTKSRWSITRILKRMLSFKQCRDEKGVVSRQNAINRKLHRHSHTSEDVHKVVILQGGAPQSELCPNSCLPI